MALGRPNKETHPWKKPFNAKKAAEDRVVKKEKQRLTSTPTNKTARSV